MAVFIELTTAPRKDPFKKLLASKLKGRAAPTTSVRRPLRGMEVKENTYAIFKVVKVDGTEVPMADSATFRGTTKNYANFLIQNIQEARTEKHQIVETFGAPFIFFFGEMPRMLDVQAILLNSQDFRWGNEWMHNYERFWRGTRLVEQCARLFLFFDEIVVEGYMMSCQAVRQADQPFLIQVAFRIFLTNYQILGDIGSVEFPIRSSIVLPAGIDVRDPSAVDVLEAASLDPTAPRALQREAQLAARRPDEYATYGTLADLARRGLVTSGQDTRTEQLFQEARSKVDNGFRSSRWMPVRGKTVDNIDEWTGAPPNDEPEPEPDGTDDLPKEIITQAKKIDIPLDKPKKMKSLGIKPKVVDLGEFIVEDEPPPPEPPPTPPFAEDPVEKPQTYAQNAGKFLY
jgi:hypothetical protein